MPAPSPPQADTEFLAERERQLSEWRQWVESRRAAAEAAEAFAREQLGDRLRSHEEFTVTVSRQPADCPRSSHNLVLCAVEVGRQGQSYARPAAGLLSRRSLPWQLLPLAGRRRSRLT